MDHQEEMGPVDRRVSVARLVSVDHQEDRVHQGLSAHQDPKASKALGESLVILVSKAHLDHKVAAEVREHRELVVTRDHGVKMDLRVSKVTRVLLESKDCLAQWERLENLVCLADLDHKDKGVAVDPEVSLAKMDRLDPPDPLEHKDLVDIVETTECQASQDPQDLQVLQDHQGHLSPFPGYQVDRKDPISRLMKLSLVAALLNVTTRLCVPSNT